MKFLDRFTINFKCPSIFLISQLIFFSLTIDVHAQSQQQATTKATESKTQQTQDAAETGKVESDKAGTPVLPPVTVEGKASEEVAGYVAKRSSTGTKTDTPIIEIPQSISVITRRELDMRSVQNFTEALRYVPGVAADNFGFDGRGFEFVMMRGFDAGVTGNFRDGLSNTALGFFSGFITDPYALERVDVLRGPSSVLFGRGDAGGIINRIYKKPSATPIREIEFQYGNFDRKRIAADIGAVSKDGKLMFRLVTLGLDTDTQNKFVNTGGDRAGNERFYIAPSVTWRPTTDTTITLMGDILNNRTGASPFYASNDGSFTGVLTGDPKFTRYAANQAAFSYQLEHHFNEIFTVRQNFRYAMQSGTFSDLNPLGFIDPTQPTLLERSAFSTRERMSQAVLDTHLQAKINTGPLHHTVLLGADWNLTDVAFKYLEGREDGALTPGIDILNPVYPQPIPKPDLLLSDSRQKIDQLGFYLQDQIRYDKNWILTLSGRYDNVGTRFRDSVAAARERSHDSALTGRAGLTYVFSNGIAPYVSYSQSFLPQPGFDSQTLLPFDPTRASQYEVGIKYQPVGSNSLYTMALFDLTKTNALTIDPSNPLRRIQTGEIGSRGAELEARAELLPGLNLIGNFTYLDVTITKSNDIDEGKMPTLVPNTTTSAWLDYSLGQSGAGWLQRLGVDNVSWMRGLGIGAGVRYVGRTFNDSQNTSTTSAYTLFDATLRYDYGPWLFTINASNIFNNHYLTTVAGVEPGVSAGNPFLGTLRTVVATLKFRF